MAAPEAPPDTPRVIAPPPALLLASLAIGWALDQAFAPLPLLASRPLLRIGLALLFAAVSIALALWAIARFRAARTAVEPWKPSTSLVEDGPYRFTRNPMYLGMAGLHIAASFALASLWPALMLIPFVAVMTRFVIEREERYLAAKFGPEATTRPVPRWLKLPFR